MKYLIVAKPGTTPIPVEQGAALLQAGLSWITVLKKRENYRRLFDGFDPEKIARYDPGRIDKLMEDKGIIRNRMKIEAAVQNAKVFLEVQNEFGSFNKYIWRFSGGKPIHNRWKYQTDIPAKTEESTAMSR